MPVDPFPFEKLPRDTQNTVVEFLSAKTMSDLRVTSKTMKGAVDLYLKKILDRQEVRDRNMQVVKGVQGPELLKGLGSGKYITDPVPERVLLTYLQKQAAADGNWKNASDQARPLAQEWLWLPEEANNGSAYALDRMNLINHAFGWFDANGYLHNEDGRTPYRYFDPSADLMTRVNAWANADGTLKPPPS
ncbi:F-box protein [Streptomyces apricus]|uniref:F-box protein n=1 Tax=Streptomyces apricus TaxID=1828112 RepID=A0A5B0AE34_9ACTN|nr:F-box protein [Streptomyces apricus]KAA0927019.1 F-box protein [Streptomyces apricus]